MVPAVGFQEVMAASGERQGALAAVQCHVSHHPLASQVTEVRLAWISGLVAPVAQIAFGHYAKRADGRQRPAVVAVEFVAVIAIHHDLAFEPMGQFEAFEEDLSRIVIAFASVSIAVTQVAAGIVGCAITFGLIT